MRQLRRPPRRFMHLTEAIPNNNWKSTNLSKAFYRLMMLWCTSNQYGRCYYCSVRADSDTRKLATLDHIVPRSARRGKPEWTHLPINLVLACSYCNSTLKRETNPLILGRTSAYRARNFDFVHPYLDNPGNHILGGFDELSGTFSAIQFLTDKGERTVELFRLAEAGMIREWEMEQTGYNNDIRNDRLTLARQQQGDAITSELQRSLSPGYPLID